MNPQAGQDIPLVLPSQWTLQLEASAKPRASFDRANQIRQETASRSLPIHENAAAGTFRHENRIAEISQPFLYQEVKLDGQSSQEGVLEKLARA